MIKGTALSVMEKTLNVLFRSAVSSVEERSLHLPRQQDVHPVQVVIAVAVNNNRVISGDFVPSRFWI